VIPIPKTEEKQNEIIKKVKHILESRAQLRRQIENMANEPLE